jgi:hypothetical protein
MRDLGVESISCSSSVFAELSREILTAGSAVRFRARGASMQPLVRDGDVVLVRPLAARLVRLGDLVLCGRDADHVVVHRVIRKQSGPSGVQLTVQGDQLLKPDGVIPGAEVYGRVVAIDREGAHIAMDRPVMRLLSWVAMLRSRWSVGRGRPFRLASHLVKRLPAFSRYLA